MNKLQVLAIKEIEISARAAEDLLHKISRERGFTDAICNRHAIENDLMVLLRKIQSMSDAVAEDK